MKKNLWPQVINGIIGYKYCVDAKLKNEMRNIKFDYGAKRKKNYIFMWQNVLNDIIIINRTLKIRNLFVNIETWMFNWFFPFFSYLFPSCYVFVLYVEWATLSFNHLHNFFFFTKAHQINNWIAVCCCFCC